MSGTDSLQQLVLRDTKTSAGVRRMYVLLSFIEPNQRESVALNFELDVDLQLSDFTMKVVPHGSFCLLFLSWNLSLNARRSITTASQANSDVTAGFCSCRIVKSWCYHFQLVLATPLSWLRPWSFVLSSERYLWASTIKAKPNSHFLSPRSMTCLPFISITFLICSFSVKESEHIWAI